MFSLTTLTDREKKLLYLLGALLAVVVLYYLLILPVRNLTQRQDSSAQIEERLANLTHIYSQYSQTRDERIRLERALTNSDDSTTTKINQWAQRHNLSGNIAYTRRTQTNIQNRYVRTNTDIRINGAPIQSLVGFMHDIERSSDLIFIVELSITKGLQSRRTYDALIKIHSYAAQ